MVILSETNFLKSSEVMNGDKITFKDAGRWAESKFKYPDGNPQQEFHISIDFKGTNRTMRLNKTNREILKKAWKNDTSVWVGKRCELTLENIRVQGQLTKSIFVNPIDETGNRTSWDEGV